MARKRDTDELRPRDRVIAVRPVGNLPEGTLGEVKMVVGQAWTRYWVAFDGGAWVNGVDASQIVRFDRFDKWKQEQEAAAARAANHSAAPSATAVAGESADSADSASASGIPAHLLERSRQARARKEAAAASAG
ncbi:MAG: hypothetical protein NVSMB12_21170 [Acidimicrobiales bacterium]